MGLAASSSLHMSPKKLYRIPGGMHDFLWLCARESVAGLVGVRAGHPRLLSVTTSASAGGQCAYRALKKSAPARGTTPLV